MGSSSGLQKSEERSMIKRWSAWLRNNILLVTTVSAVVLGIGLGLGLRMIHPSKEAILLVNLPGDIFLRALRLVVLPVMIATIISGSSSLSGKTEGRLAAYTFAYFIATSFLAALLGFILVISIQPGNPDIKESLGEEDTETVASARLLDTFLDLFRNAVPDNLVAACIQSVYTRAVEVEPVRGSDDNSNSSVAVKRVLASRPGVNSLGLIVFCLMFGGILGSMGKSAELMKRLVTALDKIVMKLVMVILWMTPVGVISLVCGKLLSAGDIASLFQQMGMFVVTVLIGLVLELLVLQPVMYFIFTRRNPYTFLGKMLQLMVTSAALSSSSAMMPFTLRTLEVDCGVDSRVTRFVVPIGVTVNMNGTAVFITISTFFIAQMNGIPMGPGNSIAVLVTATAVSVAATSVPSASLFLMTMTLSVIGAPVNDVSLLFTTEWILDRIRTINNALADAFTAGVVEHLCRKELASDEREMDLAAEESFGEGVNNGEREIERNLKNGEESTQYTFVTAL